jgi:cytochrome bd-type quinol oxidase subunit 2
MIYFGIIVGLGILGGMVYLALDKKSDFATRMASLAAIAVMMLTIIICLFVVLLDDSVPVDESVIIVGPPVKAVKEEVDSGNIFILIFIVGFLLGIFLIIVFLTLKEHRKNLSKIT